MYSRTRLIRYRLIRQFASSVPAEFLYFVSGPQPEGVNRAIAHPRNF